MWVLWCVKKTFTQQQWIFLGIKVLFNLKDTQSYTVFSASEVMERALTQQSVEFPCAKRIFFVLRRYTMLCHLQRKWSDARKGHSLHSSSTHPLKQRSLSRARRLKILFKIFARSNEAARCQVLAATWRLQFETNVDANSFIKMKKSWEVMQYMQTT